MSDRISRSHHSEIVICESITLKLDALEIETFLDWQVEFTGEIVNTQLNEVHEFEFSVGDGPYIEISTDSSHITISTYSPIKNELVSFPFNMSGCENSEKYQMNSTFEFSKE